jgi:aldehyde dehydrogenase (NAD+)
VGAARPRSSSGGRPCPAAERAKYLYRIARLLQERAREFAVLETLDGGKPIKESRDVDVPLAAAHFFYYAGWADKLDWAFAGSARRVRSASPARSSPGTSRC